MRELIERLEQLTGQDREVDARIFYALFPDAEVLLDTGDLRAKRAGVRGPLSKMPIDGWDDYDGICHHIGAGRYTASLDASIALVAQLLPGSWRVGNLPSGGGFAYLGTSQVEHVGATPALALLLALLRALSKNSGEQG